jgi:hypothetical protein
MLLTVGTDVLYSLIQITSKQTSKKREKREDIKGAALAPPELTWVWINGLIE